MQLRTRLFWYQLTALVATDSVWCAISFLHTVVDWLDHYPVGFTRLLGVCILNVLEFSSCFLEVQIAVGIMGSTLANVGSDRRRYRFSRRLKLFIPWTYVAAIVTFYSVVFPVMDVSNTGVDQKGRWSLIVLVCLLISVVCYAVTVVRSSQVSPELRKRALLRGSTYIGSFVASFGPRAVTHAVELVGMDVSHGSGSGAYRLIKSLTGLNGALNVAAYSLWAFTEVSSVERFQSGDVCTALDEPRAAVASVEALDVATFFDLPLDSTS